MVEKRVGPRQYATTRKDVLVGSVSCMVIVSFIIICTAATLHASGLTNITDAAGQHQLRYRIQYQNVVFDNTVQRTGPLCSINWLPPMSTTICPS